MLSRAIVDFCWSMVIHILRQLIFAIVKRWWFFVAWTLFLASVQLEFQLYGIFVLKWTQSCVKIRVRESKCRAVKRINQAENREKRKIRTRKHTTGRPNSKFSIAWYQKWTERINTGNFFDPMRFYRLGFIHPRSRHWKKSPRMKQSPCK